MQELTAFQSKVVQGEAGTPVHDEQVRAALRANADAVHQLWQERLASHPEAVDAAFLEELWGAFVEAVQHGVLPPTPVRAPIRAVVAALADLADAAQASLPGDEPALREALGRFLDRFAAACLRQTETPPSRSLPDPFTLQIDPLLDAVDIGHFLLDRDTRVVFWGRGMHRLYDVEPDEVLGKKLLDAFPAVRQEREFAEVLRKALQTGKPQRTSRFRHRSKRKGLRYLNVAAYPVLDGDGQVLGLRVLVDDVTDRWLKEKALDRYRQYVQTILQDAADAIIVLDEKDRIMMWNRGAEVLYGWRAEEVLGKPVTVIVPNDPKAQREIKWIGEEVRKRGFIRDWETERITRDGRKVLINLTRTAIYDAQGRFVGSSVIARDITEQRRLEHQLIQSEKLSAVGQLAAGIAHEIGSPLTAVSSLAQLLFERSEDEFFRDRLRLIRKEVERIARIVRELVDFSRPVTQKIERLNPNEIVEEAARIVQYDRRLKHKQIETDLDPTVSPVEVSFDQLLQVLINLLLNAADAIEPVEDGKVRIRTANEGDKVLIEVADNGVGIPPENLPHIFDPFFTTKRPGKGTGLGLWVCLNVVRGLGGSIDVESEPGHGATFRILLPRAGGSPTRP